MKNYRRIASSSPTMWQHICLKNRENIVQILDAYIDMLKDAKSSVAEGSEQKLYNLFETSKNYRNSYSRRIFQDQLKKYLPFTVASSMKPVESQLSQLYLHQIISVSKILVSYTIGNLKKEFFVLNFMKKPPLIKQPSYFKNTDISYIKVH